MKIVIYGKDACSDCDKAKMLCRIQSLDFEYHELDEDDALARLSARIGAPVRRVPQVFVERAGTQEYVGGYEELRLALMPTAQGLTARG
ncbi:MAG: hypothetical protein IT500_17375 [Rubrivivax sp.]|nr:hypothetical protein [Rubrivivax sp.]HNU11557.1 glutaredoxin domain-containing protein [Rubrivivax sp.]